MLFGMDIRAIITIVVTRVDLRGYYNNAYLITKCGDSGMETGVPGYIIDGDPALEYSNEFECRSGGVWQGCR